MTETAQPKTCVHGRLLNQRCSRCAFGVTNEARKLAAVRIKPTQERMDRASESGIGLKRGSGAWYDDGCTLLARYLRRGEVDQRQYDAGCRLCQDWTQAGLQPRTVGSYDGRSSEGGTAQNLSDARVGAYLRYRSAMLAIGPIAANEVESVCLFDNPAGRVGLEILRRGLTVLADHYGLTR